MVSNTDNITIPIPAVEEGSSTNQHDVPLTAISTCASCFAGAIRHGRPAGHMETLHGVSTYVTRGDPSSSFSSEAATGLSRSTSHSNSTIVFLTDGFGFNLVNNKLLADQYASRTGFRVLMPNILPGGGVPLAVLGFSAIMGTSVRWWDLVGHTKRAWASLRLMSILVPFGFRVRRKYPAVVRYVRALRRLLPLGAKLGIAGFCLGGNWSSRICAEAATDEGGGGQASSLVNAHFTAHPSGLSAADIANCAARFRVPFSVALGDHDIMLPLAEAHRVEAGLREVFRDAPDRTEVVIYERCGHGFALRADPSQTEENDGAERAQEQAVAWFRRFLL